MKENWFQPIPKNLEEAVARLNDNLFPEDLDYLKVNGSGAFHMTLSQRMRNEWLWDEKSVLNKYFWDNYKLYHADDTSTVILDVLQAKLNNKTFNINERAKHYQEYWKQYGIEPGTRPKL